jgi:RND family efflux transporter MFP subunit
MQAIYRISMVAAALCLSACGLVGDGDDPGAGRASQTLPVQAIEVLPRDLSRRIQVSSPVEALRTVRLAARTEGVLTEVLVEEGDEIAADQVLARIDVREQQAQLSQARANLHKKEANFARFEQLRERNYIDLASFEQARAELEIAGSDVELWETRVEFGTVTAGFDGTVVARYVEPGAAVSRHGPLFSIADLSSLVVRLGVSELDVGGLRVGDAVSVQIDAVDRLTAVEGRIRRVFPAADEQSRLITVEIELPDANARGIRPGYLARVRLLVDERLDVVAVPAGSVAEVGGEHFVMVINGDERLERRIIEPGIIRGSWREVVAGLETGERVLAANPLEMTPGEQVRIVGWVQG